MTPGVSSTGCIIHQPLVPIDQILKVLESDAVLAASLPLIDSLEGDPGTDAQVDQGGRRVDHELHVADGGEVGFVLEVVDVSVRAVELLEHPVPEERAVQDRTIVVRAVQRLGRG
jgi:hypothetical protein